MNSSPYLVLGYGNPGRGDDRLGPAFVEGLENLGIEGVHAEARFQLTVENAAAVAEHAVVMFVDAAMQGPEPFRFERIHPDFSMTFSSHHIEPQALLALARGLFGARPEAYLLAIRGYEFEENSEVLSEAARANLDAALKFLAPALKRGLLRKESLKMVSNSCGMKCLETRSNYVK